MNHAPFSASETSVTDGILDITSRLQVSCRCLQRAGGTNQYLEEVLDLDLLDIKLKGLPSHTQAPHIFSLEGTITNQLHCSPSL